jgi:AraC-like DNA-binding protein
MHAHFERHVYHRHSHETYSFGVTEDGAQSFTCRGSAHTSAAGMVMAFNPDDPHDGHASDELGFTYRMVHIGPGLVSGVLAGIAGQLAGLPLFTDPVVSDLVLAGHLRALNRALLGGAPALRRDELLTATIYSIAARAAARAGGPAGYARPAGHAARDGYAARGGYAARAGHAPADAGTVAGRAREVIRDGYLRDITAGDLAAATGRSRFAIHRAFTSVYGISPSDYQRQLRLRAARRLIARGRPISEAAAHAGFADQSHLTRWFSRCYGITPGGYQRAVL